jgi:hypothetical protein
MTTDAFVADIFFYRGDGASPEVFTKICQVYGISGLGETNNLVKATTFCSAGNEEYIGGLADGEEITITANYEQGDANLLQMITDVKNRTVGNYRIVAENSSPAETFAFAALARGWKLSPSVDDRNMLEFTLKISGAVTVS